MTIRTLAAVLLALAACGDPAPPAVHPMKEGEPMAPPHAAAARAAIPPIDAAVTAKLETASFAMG